MAFVVQTELMKNFQAADLAAAGKDFSAIQTKDGYAVFLTLASDNKLNAFRETSHETAYALGWQKVDLTPLDASQVTDFAVAQNPKTLNFDIAVSGLKSGKHSLWISQNNTAEMFLNFKDHAVHWQETPPPFELNIAKLYMMNLFEGSSKVQMIYADVYRHPGQAVGLVDRYLINPTEQPSWSPRTMGADFVTGSMRTCVGRPKGDISAGVYTFGNLNGAQQLIYQPSMLGRAPGHTGNISRLIAPPNSYSIASAPAKDALSTNLFLAAKGGLYLFKPDNQFDGAQPTPIYDSTTNNLSKVLFDGIKKMTARWMGTHVVLFLLNTKQQLLYTQCIIGQESVPNSWKPPVPICSQVRDYTFFVDTESQSSDFGNVVFVDTAKNNLTMLAQNLSTGIWDKSHIVLPATNVKQYQETTTFTAQIKLIDSNRAPMPNTTVTIEAFDYTTAFINGVSYWLEPGKPVASQTIEDGTLNVIQETSSLAASMFSLTYSGGAQPVIHNVDPTEKAYENLKQAQTSDGLKNITLTKQNGRVTTTSKLIPENQSGVSESIAENVKVLLSAKAALKGSSDSDSSRRRSAGQRVRRGWGDFDFGIGDLVQFIEDGIEAVVEKVVDTVVETVVEAVVTIADVVVSAAGTAYKAVIKIAGQFWTAILDTIEGVGDAVVAVFDAVKQTIDDLISWLGWLFNWSDIRRTHNFLTHMMDLYTNHLETSINTLETTISNTIDSVATTLRGLLDPPASATKSVHGSFTGKGKPNTEMPNASDGDLPTDSPQANWGSRMMRENGSDASVTDPGTAPTTEQASEIQTKITSLKQSTDKSQQSIGEKLETFQKDVASKLLELDTLIIVQKTCQLVIDLLNSAAKSIISGLFGLIKLVVNAVLTGLKAEISIPVLSGLYETYVADPGHKLSVLDVTCLVLAVPATSFYKILTGKAPFPSETPAFYNNALATTDWSALRTVLKDSYTPTRTRGGFELPIRAEIFFNGLAVGGTLILIGISNMSGRSKATGAIALAGMCAFIAYASPNVGSVLNSPGDPWNIANDALTSVAVVKSVIDYGFPWLVNKYPAWAYQEWFWSDFIGPVVDSLINIVWTGVLIWGYVEAPDPGNARDRVYEFGFFIANLCFDVGGSISILTSEKLIAAIPVWPFGPAAAPGISKTCKGIALGCNVAYAIMLGVISAWELGKYQHG